METGSQDSNIGNDAMALDMMSATQEILRKDGLIKREYISPSPVLSVGEYQMLLVSDLFDRKRSDVGDVRAFVFVPVVGDGSAVLRVEWSRNAFGFWFRDELRIPVGNFDANRIQSFLTGAVKKIKNTTDRNVPLKSQLRVLKKIKRNATRDKALRSGLVLG